MDLCHQSRELSRTLDTAAQLRNAPAAAILALELDALVTLADGNTDEAIATLEEATVLAG